jgi:spore coat polysaccharide biosynthesis protein SpsF (cytidylyltransferase family)/RimJ/RimL family protein N-acetyltransferase
VANETARARRETLCVVQARTGSTRLPGKVLKDVGAGTPMLRFLLDRLDALPVDDLVVATTTEERDDPIVDIARAAGRPVVRGSERDVLDRFVTALDLFPARNVVRLTADCPLSDPALVGEVVEHHRATRADYTTNTLPRTFPKGLDVEVVTADALRVADAEASAPSEREHVMPFLYRHPEWFRLANLRNDEPLGDERWTVDTPEDLERVRAIVAQMGDRTFGWRDVLTVVGRDALPKPGELALRPAYAHDAMFVLECRRDHDAVRFSVSGCAITPEEHERWFTARLHQPGNPMWVGEVDGAPVGTVRLDVHAGVAEVAIAVAPSARGRGFGRGLLVALLDHVRADQQVVDLVARIHPENLASMRAFRRVGFENVEGGASCDGFARLRRDPRLPMEKA